MYWGVGIVVGIVVAMALVGMAWNLIVSPRG